MSPENAGKTRDGLRAENRFLKKLLLGNGSASVVLALLCAGMWLFQRTIIMPPAVGGTYVVGARYANQQYLADQATYVLALAKTVTPNTVDNNIRVLLGMVGDDERAALKTQWEADALQIRHDGVTTVFEPHGNGEVDMKSTAVKVSGTFTTYISGKQTSSISKTFEVDFHINLFGRLTLVDVREVSHNLPGLDPVSSPSAS